MKARFILIRQPLGCAINYFLCQKGIDVRKMFDTLIAAYFIESNHQLQHNDSKLDGNKEHLMLRVAHQ